MVCVTTNANHPFESGHGRAEWYPATDIYMCYNMSVQRADEQSTHRTVSTQTRTEHTRTHTLFIHTHMLTWNPWHCGHMDTTIRAQQGT